MDNLEVSVSVLETSTQLHNAFMEVVTQHLNHSMNKAVVDIKTNLETLLVDALKMQPEYPSIIGGQLRNEFGIPDGSSKLEAIISTWISSINVVGKTFKYSGASLTGGISITAVHADFSDVLALPEAFQQTKKGAQLPWLRWLLLEGDHTIIRDYEIAVGIGRTGSMIMRAVKTGRWGVPMAFRGNINDNWVTRAIESIDTKISQLIETSFIKYI